MTDQWLDWGDHTITIDPMGNKQWIRESDTDGHSQSVARKRRYDANDVQELIGWQNRHPPQDPAYYEPTISGRQLYADPIGKGCKQWRGQERDSSRFGKLPVITAQIHDNQLADKGWGEIEAEMRERERTAGARLFSC